VRMGQNGAAMDSRLVLRCSQASRTPLVDGVWAIGQRYRTFICEHLSMGRFSRLIQWPSLRADAA